MGRWDYKFNREELTYFGKPNLIPSRLLDNSKCTVINRDNII